MNDADRLLAGCVSLYHRGELCAAEAAARQCLEDFPDDGRFWQLHGILCWQRGDLATARSALETASCLRPLAPQGRCALAHAYLALGPVDVAHFMYVSLAQDDRCPSALLPKVATGLGMLKDHATALEVCVKLAQREPRHHGAFFGMAYYMARLDYSTASILDPLVKAHNLAPRVPLYRVNLALLYAELGRHNEAYLLICEVKPEEVPENFPVHRLADIFAMVGDRERWSTFQALATMNARCAARTDASAKRR